MQQGEYIRHRLMVELLETICRERGISFSSLSDDWVLELEKNGSIRRVIGYSFDLNTAAAAFIAKDKVATHLLLQRCGVPSVEHVLLRPPVLEVQKEYIDNWKKIVVKPLEGTGGHGVKLVSGADEAIKWVASSEISAWAVSPHIDIKREIRCILLDGQPLLVYEKQAVEIDGLKMFNLGQGAAPTIITPNTALIQLAAQAQAALGLRLSAVDIIETAAGEFLVLEINGGFMMEHFMRVSDEYMRIAEHIYRTIVDALFP